MTTITCAIMVKNEAHDIKNCIESILWASEILLLDSGSTDGTQEICRKYDKVKLLETDWPGFSEQSNRALNFATSDWCFLIDADERVTRALREEIKEKIANDTPFVAYRVPRLNFFYGKKMAHCLNPKGDQPVRLIKKGFGYFQDIVHQKAVIDGAIGELKENLVHFPFKDLEEIIYKNNLYSTLGALKLADKGVRGGVVKTLTHASWAFLKSYIFKRGFLDGWPGFIIAFQAFDYTFYRYAKLMEKNKDEK